MINKALDQLNNNAIYYYHNNAQQSIMALTDETGIIVESYSYTAYGTRTIYGANGTKIRASNFGNNYGYTGRRIDNETKLIYFRPDTTVQNKDASSAETH